jgi:hypothetical protein
MAVTWKCNTAKLLKNNISVSWHGECNALEAGGATDRLVSKVKGIRDMFSTRTTGRVSSFAAAMIAAAVLVAGATAPAYASDPANDTAKSSAKAGKQKRYCVKPTTSTGTMFTAKTCMTREQWIARTGVDPVAAEQK